VGNHTDPPVLDPNAPLAKYWNKTVSELAAVEQFSFTPEMAERHHLYSLLVMALVRGFWNGNKHGQDGNYPWRRNQKLPNGIYAGGRYLGHNIACIGVDGFGEVIDFDFNHNDLFSSSVEHAESRLVRRVFSLAQVYDDWHVRRSDDVSKSQDYMNILSNVTIYTSLESCAQCSGIMALGKVKAVVYLQHDPGMYVIGNILRNLTTDALRAPLPVSADRVGLAYYSDLNKAFKEFFKEVLANPFYEDGSTVDKSQSITSFLCTDKALEIFDRAFKEFMSFEPQYPDFCPGDSGKADPRVLSNLKVQAHIRSFYQYAVDCGQRGTPHKL
jgi:tRNA(Arg) A34 adenosine deaminase TadA